MIDAPISQRRFLIALSIVSIVGFLGIFYETILGKEIGAYVEAAWLFVLAVGFLIEINYKALAEIPKSGLTQQVFAHLSTLVLGLFALFAALLTLPAFLFESPGFDAVKGILAMIAILVIILQTWVIKEE